jgi:hypothetical protein
LRGDRGINVRGIGIANDPRNAQDVTDSTAGVVAERPISKADCQEKQTKQRKRGSARVSSANPS